MPHKLVSERKACIKRWYERHKADVNKKAAGRVVKFRLEEPELARLRRHRYYREHKAEINRKNNVRRKGSRPMLRQAARAASSLRVSELRDAYLRDLIKQAGVPLTPETMQHYKLNIQIWRTKRLFSTLATASILNP